MKKEDDTPIDVLWNASYRSSADTFRLAELLREIRRIRRSIAQNQAERADQPEGTFIDPARLPPTYRTPIQTYFEKLSEQR